MNSGKVKQVAVFSSQKRQSLEEMINDQLLQISRKGYEYNDINIWNTSRNGTFLWNATIEYSVSEDVFGEEEEEDYSNLREFRYDPRLNVTTIGYYGLKAFIVQNMLEDKIDISIPYIELQKQVVLNTNLTPETPIQEYSTEVETVSVNLGLYKPEKDDN